MWNAHDSPRKWVDDQGLPDGTTAEMVKNKTRRSSPPMPSALLCMPGSRAYARMQVLRVPFLQQVHDPVGHLLHVLVPADESLARGPPYRRARRRATGGYGR